MHTRELQDMWWNYYYRLLSSAEIAKTSERNMSEVLAFYLVAEKMRNQCATFSLVPNPDLQDPNVSSTNFVLCLGSFSSKLPSPIPFAESMLFKKPPFAILTRYYVYS